MNGYRLFQKRKEVYELSRLKDLRIKRGYTQIKMQHLTGIDQSDYSKIDCSCPGYQHGLSCRSDRREKTLSQKHELSFFAAYPSLNEWEKHNLADLLIDYN